MTFSHLTYYHFKLKQYSVFGSTCNYDRQLIIMHRATQRARVGGKT